MKSELCVLCICYLNMYDVCLRLPFFSPVCVFCRVCVCWGWVGGGASRVTVAAHLSALPYAALCKNRVLLRGLMVNPIQVP